MPELPPAPKPGRKKHSSAVERPIAKKSKGKPKPLPLPIQGWVVGFAIGGVLSLAIIGWLNWATYSSRMFLPICRALAAHDLTRGLQLLKDFETRFQATRLLEFDPMLGAPPMLRIVVAVGLKDATELHAAVDAAEGARERWINSLDELPGWMTTKEGEYYPLLRSMEYAWGIRAATATGEWEAAVRIADEALTKVDEFWSRYGGVPANFTQPIIGNLTFYALRPGERDLLLTRAYACARQGDFNRALADIDEIMREPLVQQEPHNFIQPQALVLKAAIEYQQGQQSTAATTYAAAQQLYQTPIAFRPQAPEVLPEGTWSRTRPSSVGESWKKMRENGFLSLPDWFGSPASAGSHPRVWSLEENPRDLTDDLLDYLASQQAPISSSL